MTEDNSPSLLERIANVAQAVREKQKEYFRSRLREDLEQAKVLEHLLDQLLEQRNAQPSLFDDEKERA